MPMPSPETSVSPPCRWKVSPTKSTGYSLPAESVYVSLVSSNAPSSLMFTEVAPESCAVTGVTHKSGANRSNTISRMALIMLSQGLL